MYIIVATEEVIIELKKIISGVQFIIYLKFLSLRHENKADPVIRLYLSKADEAEMR